MDQIVLLGCGSQALKHVGCYGKLKKERPLRIAALVDPSAQRRELCRNALTRAGFDSAGAVCADQLQQLEPVINMADTIVDVVTPNQLHYPMAKTAVELGAKHLIIEKPLAHSLTDARKFLTLGCTINVLENYLFSSVTKEVVDSIRRMECCPRFVKTEFSKDRRLDSANGRGMTGDYVPHVFTVEMPHQIAIANHVVGSVGRVADAWHHDMILPDGRIAGHGEGAITLLHGDGVASYNFSCLQGFRHLSMPYRSVKVYCTKGVNICGFYSTSMDLQASILIYKNNRPIESRTLTDDSLKFTLGDAISSFGKKSRIVNDVKFGIDVLKIIENGRRVAETSH